MRFFRWIRKLFSPKPTPVSPPNIAAPRPSLGEGEPEVLYQRVPDLPISRGRKMKPRAIVVHYTAGWKNQKPRDAIAFMQKMGHGYLFIDEQGNCWQNIMLDESYAHAGTSKMPDFSQLKGTSSVSGFGIGIEVACGGQVNSKDQTWFKKTVEPSEIRQADRATHGLPGRFEKFTQAQEDSLVAVCLDLCRRFSIHPSNVAGHHEISPGRKDDPGGSLSMGMHRFRAMLADELNRE